MATKSSNFISCLWSLNFPPTDQIFFCFLQLSDYQLFLVATEYKILNSLPPVHVKSERTKVLICSLSKPVCEWCTQYSVCPPNAVSGIDADWVQHCYHYPRLRSRNKQHPDCAVLVVSRKNNTIALKGGEGVWHWRQSPTQSFRKIFHQEAIALSLGGEWTGKDQRK